MKRLVALAALLASSWAVAGSPGQAGVFMSQTDRCFRKNCQVNSLTILVGGLTLPGGQCLTIGTDTWCDVSGVLTANVTVNAPAVNATTTDSVHGLQVGGHTFWYGGSSPISALPVEIDSTLLTTGTVTSSASTGFIAAGNVQINGYVTGNTASTGQALTLQGYTAGTAGAGVILNTGDATANKFIALFENQGVTKGSVDLNGGLSFAGTVTSNATGAQLTPQYTVLATQPLWIGPTAPGSVGQSGTSSFLFGAAGVNGSVATAGGTGGGAVVEGFNGGSGGTTGAAGPGGNAGAQAGNGGTAGTTTGNAGNGGQGYVISGNGGNGAAGSANAGTGGLINVQSGTGGNAGGTGLAGAGGLITVTGGLGGTGSGTVASGAGGALQFVSGNGGTPGAGGGSSSGGIDVQTGAPSGAIIAGPIHIGDGNIGTVAGSVTVGTSTTTRPVKIAGGSGAFVGSCTFAAATTCVVTVPTGAKCGAFVPTAAPGAASPFFQSVSGTSLTITAAAANSLTVNGLCL